jgi:hypothetical protein
MKFGPHIPCLSKRLAARTSPARLLRHSLGLKAPRGWGWLTNPRRTAYNRVYNRTSFGVKGCVWVLALPVAGAMWVWWGF